MRPITDIMPRMGDFAPSQTTGALRGAAILGGAALLAAGLSRGSSRGGWVALAGGALMLAGLTGGHGVRAGMTLAGTGHGPPSSDAPSTIAAVTIARTPAVVYRRLRNIAEWPQLMEHLDRVEPLTDRRSRWTARGPADSRVTWESEIIDDVPERRIAWQSVGESMVPNSGWITLTPAPGGRGTEVRAFMEYEIPGGKLGSMIAGLAGRSPEQELREGLRRLKQSLEAGDIPTVEGQPAGERSRWGVMP